MKAIIIAAGMGNRLNPLTNDQPKCMLEIRGKALLQHQIDIFRSCGIEEISVVKGYEKEKIDIAGLKYYINDNYKNNNILCSLFYAEPALDDEVIFCYSDILFEKFVVKRLLESREDISLVLDIDWRGYYEGRTDHPIEEAENVIFDADNHVIEIGKILPHKDAVHGEFIGMVKCTQKGTDILKRHFHRDKELFWSKPFQRATAFEKAYLTDIFQDMVDLGVPLHCVIIEKEWIELDTVQDYERATRGEI